MTGRIVVTEAWAMSLDMFTAAGWGECFYTQVSNVSFYSVLNIVMEGTIQEYKMFLLTFITYDYWKTFDHKGGL